MPSMADGRGIPQWLRMGKKYLQMDFTLETQFIQVTLCPDYDSDVKNVLFCVI